MRGDWIITHPGEGDGYGDEFWIFITRTTGIEALSLNRPFAWDVVDESDWSLEFAEDNSGCRGTPGTCRAATISLAKTGEGTYRLAVMTDEASATVYLELKRK